ncbi:MAG: glucosamine-6-phosphate deaminase [Planctomycetota bacterium]|jgi:glucosamine-6-phosphate deaminase|nr:glucosamine-6-phosphate deaminase [Planctomycetota bacterium]MDP7252902.1 glucosamine-6-phosphate deaminase [Planctomycetota bacterium]
MKVIIVSDKQEMGKVAADLIEEDMAKKTPYVMGLATGTTPVPLYQEFIRRNKETGLDFSTVITFNLDEYVGLDPDHDQSYRYFMNKELFDHVNINKKNTFVPPGNAEDLSAAGAQYEEAIRMAGGIDYQVLGIGSNGHIGFNEPGSSLSSRTRKVKLTESTITDNSRMFEKKEDVPTEAITMGNGTILDSRRVLLMANGENKADAVANSIEGPVTATVPASSLQLHQNITWIITQDAAGKLKLEW